MENVIKEASENACFYFMIGFLLTLCSNTISVAWREINSKPQISTRVNQKKIKSSTCFNISYLSWQNTYPNLKTTCNTKLKFFLWPKLLENLTPFEICHICCYDLKQLDSSISLEPYYSFGHMRSHKSGSYLHIDSRYQPKPHGPE